MQTEEGAGVRDLSMLVARDVRVATVKRDGVVIRATGPRDQADELAGLAQQTARAVDVLGTAFGRYPWPELDVVSVPLGAGVGGMEWPGAIWLSEDVAGGGIPGMGQLGPLGDLGDLGDLGGLLGGLGLGATIETLREFVVAHEVAHQWWHAVVGNDSTVAAAVDEPLAQFSACLYWERAHGAAAAEEICPLHLQTQYRTMRALGEPDAPAQQPSEDFTSSLQYGGVVYGKAPGFYAAARRLMGEEALLSGLRALVRDRGFELVQPGDVLAALQGAAPAHAEAVAALWHRWFQERHGDEDVGVGEAAGLGGLFGAGAGGIDPEQLAALQRALEQILGATTTTTRLQ